MKLKRIIEAIDVTRVTGPPASRGGAGSDPDIASLHYQSGDVGPGGLFAAIPGLKADGHDFIPDALSRGARAVITEKPFEGDVAVIETPDARKAMALAAARFYGDPSGRLRLIGVTGTNGKTTVSYLVESILKRAGFRVGVIGTVDCRYGEKTTPNPVTTPESLDLQRILAEMVDAGVTHVVLEASSHALDLHRLEGCRFDVGVFTNLSQDHLDFHRSMDAYWESKKRLFTEFLSPGKGKEGATAVINRNDPRGAALFDALSIRKISAGRSGSDDVRIESPGLGPAGVSGRVRIPGGGFHLKSPLTGDYNVENILCAAGVGAALGIPAGRIQAGIESLARVPGRLERVDDPDGRLVFVDYAHTPDALENVLKTLNRTTPSRVICVFGCGGDRDREKRPRMGRIAGRFSNLAVITSDNPRSEPPMAIIEQIRQGVGNGAGRVYSTAELADGFRQDGCVVEPDREKAIRLGIRAAREGDAVLIAGKGHEDYQILGDRTISFDDRRVAKAILREETSSRGLAAEAGGV
ncbi:MAG: UDP-N-acetylmuramoyl-L-alanyl-D-glutamate--2,6-diaminopimelate ligase [Desulfobacterales bacterium]|nr:UDP-N-acetylmuramoyl-L-alanyl-D-glutamate--2,6-diaminopimelate ligase [Desulfobacterales bacterium]